MCLLKQFQGLYIKYFTIYFSNTNSLPIYKFQVYIIQNELILPTSTAYPPRNLLTAKIHPPDANPKHFQPPAKFSMPLHTQVNSEHDKLHL